MLRQQPLWTIRLLRCFRLLPRSRILDRDAKVMDIEVYAEDRKGMIHDVTGCFADRDINIARFEVYAVPPRDALYKISLEVQNFDVFSDLYEALLQIPSVKAGIAKKIRYVILSILFSMQFRQPSFDQARDPLAHVYLGSARNYDTYLRGEYGHNYMERRGEWDSHYHELRRAFEEAVSYVQDHGVPRKHMNIAIIGPGFNPVGKDIDSDIIRQDLQQIKTLVLMDFSTAVIRSALDDLMQHKVPHEKMLGMQFDVTNGLSTAYYSYIMQKFQAVQTEEQMSRVTEEIEKVEMEELAQILARIEMNPDLARNKPDYLLEGGENDSRQLNLTLDHGEKNCPYIYGSLPWSRTEPVRMRKTLSGKPTKA